MAIKSLSTVYLQDFKTDEIEIGIVSTAENEDPKIRGLWQVLSRMKSEDTYWHMPRRIRLSIQHTFFFAIQSNLAM